MSSDTFVKFYRQHHRLVLMIAEQRLNAVADAEDAAAEVFRIAWVHHAAGNELALPWVYQVLRNVVGNEYRRRSRAPALMEKLPDVQEVDARDLACIEVIETRRHLRDLKPGDRSVLFMVYWEDLTRGEISQIVGCSEATVRVRLYRAKKRFSKLANDSLEPEGVLAEDR